MKIANLSFHSVSASSGSGVVPINPAVPPTIEGVIGIDLATGIIYGSVGTFWVTLDEYLNPFEIEITTTSASTSFGLQKLNLTSKIIDWGDGSYVDTSISTASNTFADAGTYRVKTYNARFIYDSVGTTSICSSTKKIDKLISIGNLPVGVTNFSYAFRQNTINEIRCDWSRWGMLTNLQGTFLGNPLTCISDDASKLVDCVNLPFMFYNCTPLLSNVYNFYVSATTKANPVTNGTSCFFNCVNAEGYELLPASWQ